MNLNTAISQAERHPPALYRPNLGKPHSCLPLCFMAGMFCDV